MADDLDELIGATGPGGHSCRVGWWLEHGEHPDIGRLAEAVANPSARPTAVAEAFKVRGMDVGYLAVSRHRRRMGVTDGPGEECKCPR